MTVLWFSPSPALNAAELTGYVTATTDYVKRGVTQSDSDSALQLAIDLGFRSGFYAGVWASTVDINGPTLQRDTEVNYYIGYTVDVAKQWSIGVNAVAYAYPGADGNFDYDYIEYAVIANYSDRFWFEYAYSNDLYNTGLDTHNYEAYAEHAISSNWVVGGGAGYYDVSSLSGTGYGYWQLGVTRSIRQFDIDLRYHDTNRWVPIVSAPERVDSRLVLSVRFSF